MGPRPHLSFGACQTISLASEILVSMGPSPHLRFFQSKQRLLDQNYKSLWIPDFIYVFFCIQNSDFSTGIGCLYMSQPSSVVLCIHNGGIMTRINSLYGSETSPVDLWMQTACLDPEWWLSICPSLHLWFCAFKTTTLVSESLVSIGPRFHLWLCPFKTATLASKLLVSTGPSPHLLLLYAKQRL